MMDYFSTENNNKREEKISLVLGRGILESKSLERIKKVSFLGVLNIVAGVPEELRYSRYDHSVSVAYLTWYYCQNLELPEDVSITATLLALIHDITHPPFSHSTEIYLQARAGSQQKHTTALRADKIKKVITESFDTLPKILRGEGVDGITDRLFTLFDRHEREKYHAYLIDMFDTPFCPDTFDGVNRGWQALNSSEGKHRLEQKGIFAQEPLDPMSLVRFASSTTHLPLLYRSSHAPTKANLILRFHDLTKSLYNEVIYSTWQTSAMVMFSRAIEIAYREKRNFQFTNKDDDNIINNIEQNTNSDLLYQNLKEGRLFSTLSDENSKLHKWAIEYYEKAMKQHKKYKKIKDEIESLLSEKMKVSKDLVYFYCHNPLIWDSENISFKELIIEINNRQETGWLLLWDPKEGEPDKTPKIEVYFAKSFS